MEAVVLITLHASGADLRRSITGVASIFLVFTLKVTSKATGHIVKRPSNQMGWQAQITGGSICAALTSWGAFLAL